VNNLQMPTASGAAPAYYLNASGSPVSTAPSASQPTGVPFFIDSAATTQTVPPSGITAQTIAVNPAILQSPYEIAAAQSANANDGSNAQAMADLGQATSPGAAVPLYNSQVSGLGTVVQAAQSDQTTAQSLLTQAQTMQQSVSGVSINTEVANIAQYQDVYTAASKALVAMQTMLQSLLAAVS
jgi:flagellar hook-associated protein 1 FlgK